MAGIYVSYKSSESSIVDRLLPLLEARGHRLVFEWGQHLGVSWREEMLTGLTSCDAMIVVWSDLSQQSQYVPAEVGAARATSTVAVLPVLVGDTPVPPYLQDLVIERVHATDEQTLAKLAKKLDDSIAHHVQRRDQPKVGRPRIFISHRHKDHALVSRLIDFITAYFRVEATDIRATSVSPYRLRVGENTSARLRRDIADADVVLGILGEDTMDSTYVAFELGSAWGQGVWTCPLLAHDANESHIPAPIRDLAPLKLTVAADCNQLLENLATLQSLPRRTGVKRATIDRKVNLLVKAARAPAA